MESSRERNLGVDGETVESLTKKLEVERRVQYGAEKMLDVIEQKGATAGDEQDQIRERINAQLEQANAQIKALEAQLAQFGGASPQKRKRPQPRLNGYASTSSLKLSSSYTSSHLSGGSRPRANRAESSATASDRWNGSGSGHGTPHRRNGDQSPGQWSSTSALGGTGMARGASGAGSAYSHPESAAMWDQPSGQTQVSEADSELLGTVHSALHRLRILGREFGRQMRGKGKGKEVQLGEEPWRCMVQAADLLKRSPGLKELLEVDTVIQADWSTPRHRSAGYRLLRSVISRARWGRMLDAGLEWLLIRTLARNAKAVVEREQALLLLRSVSALARSHPGHIPHTGPSTSLISQRVPLTDGLIRAIVAIAENSQDAMWIVCMETLVEIGILDIERLVRSDALRIVLLSFVNGPSELGPAVTGMLLYLANAPEDRRFLIPGSDVEMALTGLTEGYGQTSARQAAAYQEKLQNSVKCISLLLGSWSGLIYLCMDQYRAVKSLVSSLLVPVAEMRDAVLDLVIAALHIKTPSFTQAFLDGKRLTIYNRTQEAASEALHETIVPEHVETPLTLVDQYIALILAIFLECNLMETLVTLIEENVSVSRKATLLLGEILRMANRILPSRYAAQLQALPKLFNGATAFSDANERHFALSALTSINSLDRNQAHAHRHLHGLSRPRPSRLRASSLNNVSGTGTGGEVVERARGIRGVRDRMGISVEDKLFQQMIVDSGVLLGRDHTKWNFDLVIDLIEGPLHTPKRMDEAIRATKFVRRLMGFLQPHNNRFSSIKRTRPNHKWVQLACGLVSTMLTTPEGLKYLREDKLLKQLADCFIELETKPFKTTAYLAAERVEGSLMYGYFELIGVLSAEEEGIKLMEQNRLFNSFYRLFDLGQRDDIVRLLIECFDYTIDSHARILLAQALTASSPTTRLFATHHLGRALQDTEEWPIESAIQDWALQLLISQLYDTSTEVCEVAVMYLEEMCADARRLKMVVDYRPHISHLDDASHALFMRFLSTSTGFLYLREAGCIDQELESWMTERNLLYVIEVETFVTSVLRPFTSDTVDDTWDFDGMTPTHFLGELTKTPEGCMFLREKGLVSEFAEVIRMHGMESGDQSVMTNVKSVLWALGHIGSTKGGLPFLEDEEIIEVIVEIAEQSPILTMKGVCFFVLGLISTTVMGAEILEEMGWVTTRTALGTSNGICLPADISRFAYIQPWVRENPLPDRPGLPKLAGLEAEIMLYITNLSNYVLATKASQHLKRIRSRHPRYFSYITLFHRALRMVSTNHYLPPVRGFILDLFDIQLTPDVLSKLRRLEAAAEDPNGASMFLAGAGTRTASPLKVDGTTSRPGSRGRPNSGLAPLTPHHATKPPSPESNAERERDDAGSPRRSTDSATRGTIDPHEYRRRATSSPGPSSPSRSYSDRDDRAIGGGRTGLGGRMRGLTISTVPMANEDGYI